MSGMVFCRGCGKEIHESARACPNCGATQSGSGQGNKNRIAAALLALFLGGLGFINFTLEKLVRDFCT